MAEALEIEEKEMNKKDMKDRERNEVGSSQCGTQVVSGQEMMIEEVFQAITLEIEKTGEDQEYWPAQWRTHWVALYINCLALLSKIEDKLKDEAKEHEFSGRISHALEQVEKVFDEMENHMFGFVCDGVGITKFTIPYQPKHWKDEIKALAMTGLALAVLMEGKGKEREYSDPILAALSDVLNVFLDVERFASR